MLNEKKIYIKTTSSKSKGVPVPSSVGIFQRSSDQHTPSNDSGCRCAPFASSVVLSHRYLSQVDSACWTLHLAVSCTLGVPLDRHTGTGVQTVKDGGQQVSSVDSRCWVRVRVQERMGVTQFLRVAVAMRLRWRVMHRFER